jgi:hypothetical protein
MFSREELQTFLFNSKETPSKRVFLKYCHPSRLTSRVRGDGFPQRHSIPTEMNRNRRVVFIFLNESATDFGDPATRVLKKETIKGELALSPRVSILAPT